MAKFKLPNIRFSLPKPTEINPEVFKQLQDLENPIDVMRETNGKLISILQEQHLSNSDLAKSNYRLTVANVILALIAASSAVLPLFDKDEQEIQRLNSELLQQKEQLLQYTLEYSGDAKQLREMIYQLEIELKKLSEQENKNER